MESVKILERLYQKGKQMPESSGRREWATAIERDFAPILVEGCDIGWRVLDFKIIPVCESLGNFVARYLLFTWARKTRRV